MISQQQHREPHVWSVTITHGAFVIKLPNCVEEKDEEFVRGVTELFLKSLHRFIKKPERFPAFIALRSGVYATESDKEGGWAIYREETDGGNGVVAVSCGDGLWADDVNFIAPQI